MDRRNPKTLRLHSGCGPLGRPNLIPGTLSVQDSAKTLKRVSNYASDESSSSWWALQGCKLSGFKDSENLNVELKTPKSAAAAQCLQSPWNSGVAFNTRHATCTVEAPTARPTVVESFGLKRCRFSLTLKPWDPAASFALRRCHLVGWGPEPARRGGVEP